MKWFTSDLHLGHDAICVYCKRPFKNAAHMDKRLIRNINQVVKSDDDLYILGDFSIKTKNHRGAAITGTILCVRRFCVTYLSAWCSSSKTFQSQKTGRLSLEILDSRRSRASQRG